MDLSEGRVFVLFVACERFSARICVLVQKVEVYFLLRELGSNLVEFPFVFVCD